MTKRATRNKLIQVREPNGRLSRSTAEAVEACAPAEVRRLRDAAIRGMRDQEWGTHLGRLFLEGKIPGALYEAGRRWSRLAALATAAIRAPKAPGASAFIPRANGEEADPDSHEGRKIAARELETCVEFAEAHGALWGGGELAVRAVRDVCESDRPPVGHEQLRNLRVGLEWLALHWGLTQPLKNVRRA
jgi:hypothetical protein